MVITRTPLRISFFGGGTDYPVWYKENGGVVLSSTINKYNYITCRRLPPFFDYKTRVVWSRVESVKDIEEIIHPSVRETLKFLNIKEGLGIHYDGDLPSRSGLGSSSAFTVGLLNAVHALQGVPITKKRLAEEAIHIEQERIKENVGSQDQTAAAFGGFNKIEFSGNHEINVIPLNLDPTLINRLQEHMMLFFTGLARTASDVALSQIKNTPDKKAELLQMKEIVSEALDVLNKGEAGLHDFGRLLDKSWNIKRSLSSDITNDFIDKVYADAIQAGALGGKLLGAGGGGFILIFAEPEVQPRIREKLKNLLYVPFNFEKEGSSVIYKMS